MMCTPPPTAAQPNHVKAKVQAVVGARQLPFCIFGLQDLSTSLYISGRTVQQQAADAGWEQATASKPASLCQLVTTLEADR